MGTSVNLQGTQLLFRQAVKWGVTYWDTAHSYAGGQSELAIGKYLAKFPEDRKRIFLVTKSHGWTVEDITRDLEDSLERMQTDYVDLFFIHSVSSVMDMSSEKKQWSEKMKTAGKIRLFGFSTHSNMEACLLEGSKLGWIDGIMMTYNCRLMHTDRMRRAVDACHKSGIGLTAMKTQGGGQVITDSDSELELAGRFLKKGFTNAQARLKAIWKNPQIASICSEMPNMSILMANTAAAMDKTEISARDTELLKRVAHETRSGYCSGCSDNCESAVGGEVPIGKVMRYLMYSRSYGDRDRARRKFQRIPVEVRQRMRTVDYTAAEEICPQKMRIVRLIHDALDELS
jgi:predicted aldo/keto reductase-like oxidoreductase